MKTQIKKYAGLALAGAVVIAGIASAAITPIPTINNSFAVVGQIVTAADINKLAQAINIIDARDTSFQEQLNLRDGGVPNGQTPIIFQGKTYGTVTSPVTGKVWLDRNIGASRICTNEHDELCFGDYVQWGRPLDEAKYKLSSTTTTRMTSITPTGWPDFYNFVIGHSDWTTADADGSQRSAFLAKTNGTGVCPTGFRVPTEAELAAENLTKNSDTYGTTKVALKLPLAGRRDSNNGAVYNTGVYGYLWSSTASGESHARDLNIVAGSFAWHTGTRASGFSVRCVK